MIEAIYKKIYPALKVEYDIILVFGGKEISKYQRKTLIECGLENWSTLYLRVSVPKRGSGIT